MNAIAKQALDEVNELREQHGCAPLTDLPKGGRANFDCPIAMALKDINPDARMFFGLYAWTNHGQTYSAPMGIRRFVREFGTGKLPEYDR